MLKNEFLSAFNPVREFYKFNCSEAVVDLYFEAFIDVDFDILRILFKEALKECIFMPKIAELYNIAYEKKLLQKEQKSLSISERKEAREIEANEALNLAIETAQKFGKYESICFENGALNEAIRKFGGWLLFCNSNFFGGSAEAQGNRKHFKELYLSSVARTGYRSNISHFKGILECENSEFTPLLINANCEAIQMSPQPVNAIEAKKQKLIEIALKKI